MLLVSLCLLVPALLHFAAECRYFSEQRLYDLPLFTQAAIRHWQGEPVYARAADLLNQYKPGAIVFKFPPPYLFLFLPWFDAGGEWLVHFQGGFITVAAVLYAVMLLLACKLVWCASNNLASNNLASNNGGVQAFPSGRNGFALFVLLVLVAACWFVPILHVLGATSVENFLICMAVIAFVSMQRWPWLAGCIFAYLAMIKLYPAFLLLYPLLTRQWRVVGAAAVSFVLIAMASIVIFGWEENRFYVTQILPILLSEPVSEDWTDMFMHASGNLGIVKVLVTYGLLPSRSNECLNAIRLPLVALMIVLVWFRAGKHESGWSSLLGYALVVVTMMVCLPNLFYPYLTVLLFPLVVLCGFLAYRRQWWWLLVLMLPLSSLWVNDTWTIAQVNAYQLLSPTDDVVARIEQAGAWTFLWQEHPMLGLLMVQGRVVPFTPYIAWLALALCLFFLRPERLRE